MARFYFQSGWAAQPSIETEVVCSPTGSRLILLLGGQLKASIKKLTATAKGLSYNYAIQTKIKVQKNQLPSPYTVSYEGEVICTPHGMISADKDVLDSYRKEHISYILKQLNDMSSNSESVKSDEITYETDNEEFEI